MKTKKSTAKTGNDYQTWCAKMLEEMYPGSSIHNQRAVGKFIPSIGRWISQRNDLLGCIDILVIVPGRPPLLIQCTAHKSFAEKLNELVKIPWSLNYCEVQVWMKRAPGRTEIRALESVGATYILVPLGEIRRRKLEIYGAGPYPNGPAR